MENQHIVQSMTTFALTFTCDEPEEAQPVIDGEFFRTDGLMMAHGGLADMPTYDEEDDEYFNRHRGFLHLTYETHVFDGDDEIEVYRQDLLKHLWMTIGDSGSKGVDVFTTARLTVPTEAQMLLFGPE